MSNGGRDRVVTGGARRPKISATLRLPGEASQSFHRHVDRNIKQAEDAGAFADLLGSGQALEIHDTDLSEEIRAPFRVLANAGLAPYWVALAGEIERRVGDLRGAREAHKRHMRAARNHAMAYAADSFKARFRTTGRAHAIARLPLGAEVAATNPLTARFHTIAPAGALRPKFLPHAELRAIDAIWPWPDPGDESA